LYPKCDQQEPKADSFNDSVSIGDEYKQHSCSTFYIQIFDEDGKIRKDAGVELLNTVLEEK
jgi:hypothetical protein